MNTPETGNIRRRLEGAEAISYAEANGCHVCKYADPTEDARQDLTIKEAREVAREDPRLLYVDIPQPKQPGGAK